MEKWIVLFVDFRVNWITPAKAPQTRILWWKNSTLIQKMNQKKLCDRRHFYFKVSSTRYHWAFVILPTMAIADSPKRPFYHIFDRMDIILTAPSAVMPRLLFSSIEKPVKCNFHNFACGYYLFVLCSMKPKKGNWNQTFKKKWSLNDKIVKST